MQEFFTETLARALLREEISRIVEKAKADGEIVRTGEHSLRLLEAYPNANFPLGRTIDELTVAAAAAGLAVELDRSDR